MKKGFTLIEIIGVVIILGLVAILSFPKIIKMFKTTENDLNESARQLIISASSQYVAKYQNNYIKKENYNYCIDLRDLVKENLVSSNIIGDLDKEIEVKIVDGNYQYTILESECKEIYHDESGASIPELVDGMIPVIYSNNEWVYADIYSKWYDYDRKEWANAIVLKNNPSKTYQVNDAISMDDIALMFVWVPRYEYIIPTESIGTTGTPNAIDIKFIDAAKSVSDSGYKLHPGFTFGGVNKNGLWFGKFESSTTDSVCNTTATVENCNKAHTITIKPDVQSLRFVNLANIYLSSLNVKETYNLNKVDTHVTRYLEWTTASYLTNSIYGRCSNKTSCVEVSRNNSSLYYTGRSDGLGSEGTEIIDLGNYTYETSGGVLASTTGNIYGIYDMNGGTMEYAMGFLASSNIEYLAGNSATYSSGFNGYYSNSSEIVNTGIDLESKYYDTFTTSIITSNNYSALLYVNGTANMNGIVKELMDSTYSINWYGDFNSFVKNNNPIFIMGGSNGNPPKSGIFASHNATGAAHSNHSFRTVLVND